MWLNSDGTNSFWQWDIDRYLILTDIAVDTEIHFAHARDECAYVTKAVQSGDKVIAKVPNIILQQSGSILAFSMLKNGSEEYTKLAYQYTVKPRARPEDYVYVEPGKYKYEEYNTALDELVETTKELTKTTGDMQELVAIDEQSLLAGIDTEVGGVLNG